MIRRFTLFGATLLAAAAAALTFPPSTDPTPLPAAQERMVLVQR